MKRILFYSMLLMLVFTACREDDIDTGIIIDPPIPNVLVEAEIDGIVTDVNGNALADVTVVSGSESTFTDERGHYIIDGLLSRDHTLLRVEKDGYFTAFPVITTRKDSRQTVNVILYERNVAGTLAASSGGTIDLPSGGSIDFPPSGFVDEDGNLYSGSVNVYAYFIDPTSSNLNAIMPGNLTAIDTDGQLQGLSSFGMMNVELESASGEKLDLNTNATLRMPIPDDLQATAPANMPLWFFDESDGFWKEEGTATRNGNIYEGEVGHFTFWNCDVPFDLIELSGTIQVDGVAAEDVRVCVTRNNSTGTTRCTYTNNRGIFVGKVPADESLFFEVIDLCEEVMYSDQIGNFSSDTDLGVINIDDNSEFVTISGTLLDCNMAPVTQGYAYISSENGAITTASVNSNGEFSVYFNVCESSEITVLPVDVGNGQQGSESTYSIDANIDAGTLIACGTQISELFEATAVGLNVYIENCKMWIPDSSGIGAHYQIKVIQEEDPGDAVHYVFDIIDWNNNPGNPNWGVSVSRQIFGDPSRILSFGIEDVDLVQFSDVPGEYTVFEFPDCAITDEGPSPARHFDPAFIRMTALVL